MFLGSSSLEQVGRSLTAPIIANVAQKLTASRVARCWICRTTSFGGRGLPTCLIPSPPSLEDTFNFLPSLLPYSLSLVGLYASTHPSLFPLHPAAPSSPSSPSRGVPAAATPGTTASTSTRTSTTTRSTPATVVYHPFCPPFIPRPSRVPSPPKTIGRGYTMRSSPSPSRIACSSQVTSWKREVQNCW